MSVVAPLTAPIVGNSSGSSTSGLVTMMMYNNKKQQPLLQQLPPPPPPPPLQTPPSMRQSPRMAASGFSSSPDWRIQSAGSSNSHGSSSSSISSASGSTISSINSSFTSATVNLNSIGSGGIHRKTYPDSAAGALPPRGRALSPAYTDARSPSQSPRASIHRRRPSAAGGSICSSTAPRSRANSTDSPVPRPPGLQRSLSVPSVTKSNTTPTPATTSKVFIPTNDTVESLERALDKIRRKASSSKHPSPSATVASLWNRLGNVHFRQGRMGEAIRSYKEAVLQGGDASGSAGMRSEHLAAAYSNLGTVYWSTGQVDMAVNVLQQALSVYELDLAASFKGTLTGAAAQETSPSPTANKVYGKSPCAGQIANCFHQLGLCHALQRRFDMALAALERSKAIREARLAVTSSKARPSSLGGIPGGGSSASGGADGATEVAIGRAWDAIGKVHWMSGDYDSALHAHEEALFMIQRGACSAGSGRNSPRSQQLMQMQTLFMTVPTLLNIAAAQLGRENYHAALAVLADTRNMLKSSLQQQQHPQKWRECASLLLQTYQAFAHVYQVCNQDKEMDFYQQEVSSLSAMLREQERNGLSSSAQRNDSPTGVLSTPPSSSG